jgi:hypothetical protein
MWLLQLHLKLSCRMSILVRYGLMTTPKGQFYPYLKEFVSPKLSDSGAMLQAGKLRVPFPTMLSIFFNLPNPSSHTVSLGLTQPLTEISTRKPSWGQTLPMLKADDLTDICEPIVYKTRDPRRLTTL